MKHKEANKRSKKTPLSSMNSRMGDVWKGKLKHMLKTKRMSQRALAEKAGLGSTSIRHMVNKADTVTVESLKRVADAVDMPLTYFISGNAFVVQDMAGEDLVTASKIFVLPIHGPHDEPGESHGHGFVTIPEKQAGTAPFAFQSGDGSMLATGANYPVDPLTVIAGTDVVIYDANTKPSPGSQVVVDISDDGEDPIWAVRVLEQDDEQWYAAALSRSHGRKRIDKGKVVGTVTFVFRPAT